jgi:hypothetical protein
MAIEEQVRAYGGPQLQLTQKVMTRFSEAIEKSGVDVVPRVVVGSNGQSGAPGSGSSLMEALLAMLLHEREGGVPSAASRAPRTQAQRLREELGAQIRHVGDAE